MHQAVSKKRPKSPKLDIPFYTFVCNKCFFRFFQIPQVKSELPLSPDTLVSPTSLSNLTESGSYTFPTGIRFSPFFSDKWMRLANSRLVDMATSNLIVTADKGFNYSSQDESFIVQKKNHFQVTCEVGLETNPRFVRKSDGSLQEISYLQVNFYGVKSDVPSTHIRIEQSQSDRTKKTFHPVRVDFSHNGPNFQVLMVFDQY
jgi:hypothetical protein